MSSSSSMDVWTEKKKLYGETDTLTEEEKQHEQRQLTPNPSTEKLIKKPDEQQKKSGVTVQRFLSQSHLKSGSLSSFQRKAAKLQDVIDMNTVTLITMDKLQHKQQEILLHFNRRCVFCRKAIKTYDATDAKCNFFNDRKNSKIFVAHKRCGLKAAKKCPASSFLLSATKLSSFQMIMSDEQLHQEFQEAKSAHEVNKCAASIYLIHPLSNKKKFYSMENVNLVQIGRHRSKEKTFVSDCLSSFHVLISYVKLRIEFHSFKVPPIEVALDLFQLAHQAEFGLNVMCEVEVDGVMVTLEFKLHKFTQTDSIESEHSSSGSDEAGEAPSVFKTMKRVEFLLQDTRFMVKLSSNVVKDDVQKAPTQIKISKSKDEAKSKKIEKQPQLRLDDPNSDSSSESAEQEYQVETEGSGSHSRIYTEECEDEEVDQVDHQVLIPLPKIGSSLPQTQISSLQKFKSASQIQPKPSQFQKAAFESSKLDDSGIEEGSKQNERVGYQEGTDLSSLKKTKTSPASGVAVPKFTSWAGVQNLGHQYSGNFRDFPSFQSGSQFYNPSMMPQYPMPQYAYHYPGMAPMGGPDHQVLQPPPGFMKRGLVETSQGMKLLPPQKQTNPISSGSNDNSKKKKKQTKKKNQEKSVAVTYYGERLTLSMGVDAKDNQVTQFEAKLFASPHKVEAVDGKIVQLARSFSGSKALQGYLAKGSHEIVNKIIGESLEGIVELMTNKYGNYFCQKLFQTCSARQRLSLVRNIASDFFKISSDWSGTHSMQSLIGLINLDEEFKIVEQAISGRVFEFAVHTQATHVLQKVIAQSPTQSLPYVFDPVLENLISLCNDQNGLCVVKKVISSTKEDEKLKRLAHQMIKITKDCVQDPYGNYAVQHALECWIEDSAYEYHLEILGVLLQHPVQYSSSKYSSNVIEKCIDMAPQKFSLPFASIIIQVPESLPQLLNNSFGNYVLQKLLETMPKCEILSRLVGSLQMHLRGINDKTVKSKWENIIKTAVHPLENGFGSHYPAEFIAGGYQQPPQHHSPASFSRHYTPSPTGLVKQQQPLNTFKLNVEAKSFPGRKPQ